MKRRRPGAGEKHLSRSPRPDRRDRSPSPSATKSTVMLQRVGSIPPGGAGYKQGREDKDHKCTSRSMSEGLYKTIVNCPNCNRALCLDYARQCKHSTCSGLFCGPVPSGSRDLRCYEEHSCNLVTEQKMFAIASSDQLNIGDTGICTKCHLPTWMPPCQECRALRCFTCSGKVRLIVTRCNLKFTKCTQCRLRSSSTDNCYG